MTEQAWNWQAAQAALRPRRRQLAILAAAGLLVGVAAGVLMTNRYSSATLILLPPPTTQQSSSSADADTQVLIVHSHSVLEHARHAVSPALSAGDLDARLEVAAETAQLIRVTVSDPQPSTARRLSQAVADAYLTVVRDAERSVTASTLSDLRNREGALSTQLQRLQTELDSTSQRQRTEQASSADARRDAQLLAQLRAEQSDLALQLDKVRDEIATSQSQGTTTGQGTTIIQPASPPTGTPLWLRAIEFALLGMLALPALAAAAFVLRAQGNSRVRNRDEIADALGCPVLADVDSRSQRSIAGWSKLLKTHEPTSVEAWAFRRALRVLAPRDARVKRDSRSSGRIEHPASVCLVALSGDAGALAVGVQFAVFAADFGLRTRLVPGGDPAGESLDEATTSLWAACADSRSDPRPMLSVGAGHSGGHGARGPADAEDANPDETPVDLTVVLRVVDRERPSIDRVHNTAVTVLLVSAGSATRDELARVALAVDTAGHPLAGVVVADAAPGDQTTGRHPLDERALAPFLPMGLTGIASGVNGSRPSGARRT